MFRTNFGGYKYLGFLFMLNLTFLIVANLIAGRLVSIFGVGVSVAEFPFPLCYLICSIITEVYGYRMARSATWLSCFCMILAEITVYLAILPATPDFFKDGPAYQTVFSLGLRIALAGFVALVSGDLFNSYVFAKLKIWSKGKHFWLRFIIATVLSEGVNTVLFFGIAFYGIWSNEVLSSAILAGWLLKTVVELALLPATYPLVGYLKKIENVDHFDYNTNFNPFILDTGDHP